MLDQFREEVVTRRTRTMENLMMVFANIIMVVSAIFAMFMLQTLMMLISTHGLQAGMIVNILITLFFAASASVSGQDPHRV